MSPRPPTPTLFPYTTLFRSQGAYPFAQRHFMVMDEQMNNFCVIVTNQPACSRTVDFEEHARSEEHTSELQSQSNLVCRLLLEKKKESNMTGTHDAVEVR